MGADTAESPLRHDEDSVGETDQKVRLLVAQFKQKKELESDKTQHLTLFLLRTAAFREFLKMETEYLNEDDQK